MLWTLAAVDDLLASRRPVRAPKRRERGKLGRNFFSRRGLKRKVGWRAQRSSHAHTQSPSQTNISYLLYTSYLETCRHLCPSVVSSDQSVMSLCGVLPAPSFGLVPLVLLLFLVGDPLEEPLGGLHVVFNPCMLIRTLCRRR